MLNEQDLKEICSEICKKAGYEFSLPVKINGRLTATLGRVKGILRGEVFNCEYMEFSAKFLETATLDSIINVAKHECAHYLVAETTHQRHGHDAVFKEMCKKLDCTNDKIYYDYNKTKADTEIYKYLIVCKECGRIVGKYHRAGKVIKNIDDYTCKCGGCLSIVTN